MRRLFGQVIMVLLLASMAAFGQTFRGAINGTVEDPSGAVVPGANVTITNAATGGTQSMVTTSNGQFAFQDGVNLLPDRLQQSFPMIFQVTAFQWHLNMGRKPLRIAEKQVSGVRCQATGHR